MENDLIIKPCIKDAVSAIDTYITQTTGIKPTQEEIAKALGKFFVLKEILEFVKLERGDE